MQERPFTATNKIDDTFSPFFEGRDVGRFLLEWDGSGWIQWGEWLAEPRDISLFGGPRLLFRKVVGERLFGTYISTKAFSNTLLYILKVRGDEDWNATAILSILNSGLMGFLFRKMFAIREDDTFPQILLDDFAELPIRTVLFHTPIERRNQLAEKSCKLYKRCLSEGHACVLEFATHHLELGELDVVHDLLAYLAEQMIELNKQKQAEVKRFLAWLEESLQIRPKNGKSGIDSLAGKTIIRNYLGDYQKGEKELPWSDFEYRLYKNRNRFNVNLSEVKGEIQAEYEQSLAVLLPIKRQLAHTDALIDQIVYKLYGLTDEEIAIIEGPAYEQALGEAKAAVVEDSKLQEDPEAAAEVMAETILPAAQRLRQQVALRAERERLDQALPGWHLFPDEVATFLLTAEYNLRNLPDHLDFSTSVIAYAKAVERMLYHRLFLRFRDEAGVTDADARNKFMQQFLRGEKKLTLGSMSIILQSSKETALRTYIQTLYPLAATTFFGSDGVVARLDDPDNLALRNAAAHDQTLSKEDAQAARAWALGILSYL